MASIKTGAIVVTWAGVVAGRESQLLKILYDVFEYAKRLERAGRIDETRFFVATTGPNRDTLMVFGQMEELARLLIDDEFESHLQDGMTVVRNLEVALWAGGPPDTIMDGLMVHAQKLKEHGLV